LRARREQTEKLRLLYVTATRARTALHWMACLPADQAGPVQPASNSLLHVLWPAVEQEFLRAVAAKAEHEPDATVSAKDSVDSDGTESHTDALRRLPASWRLDDTVASPIIQRLPLPVTASQSPTEFFWVGLTGRAVGTVIHAELQRYANEFEPARLASARPEGADSPWHDAQIYRLRLTELGVPKVELETASQLVRSTLETTLQDQRARWLLQPMDHRYAASELRLTGLHEGELIQVVIDRMLVDREGVRWIVDFKTGAHEGGNLDEFIAREVQRYRPQLARYASLARHLGPEAVRCALYFPRLGVFRDWST
jgi:ATP-dependent exoDNAse (exonuclease V) beta subunit